MADIILIVLCITVCTVALIRSYMDMQKSEKRLNRIQTLMQMHDKGLISAQQIGTELGVPILDHLEIIAQESQAMTTLEPALEPDPVIAPEPEEPIGRYELLDLD